MPRSSHTVKPGVTLNPLGANGAKDAKARRQIGEVFRALATAEELGRAMLAIAAGVDPFAAQRRSANADNLPTLVAGEIDWSHRMEALKLFVSYHSGKPPQSVVVDAQIQGAIALEASVQTGPVDFSSMPPEVRAALRMAAAAALGKPLARHDVGARQLDRFAGQLQPTSALAGAIDVHAEEVPRERASQAGGQPTERPARHDLAAPAETVSLDDALAVDEDGVPLERAPLGGRGVQVSGVEAVVDHVDTVVADEDEHKEVRLEFPGSANIADAVLVVGGPLTVRFKDTNGAVARTYRYANVTPEMMAEWGSAESAGAWFARRIRKCWKAHPVIEPRIREPGVVL